MRRERRHLVFYTRPECHLCAMAAPRVRAAALWTGFLLQEVNIDDDPELAVDYGLRIPVLAEPGGMVLVEGEIRNWPLWRAILVRRWRKSGK